MTGSYTVENWKEESRHLIMIPYAHISTMETGLNVGNKDRDKQKEMYLKNCCVALVSAKVHNPESDVALVTNIEIPEAFLSILAQAGVAVIRVPFDKFNFGDKYVWGLAFYKLCAQYYISHNTDYEAVACLDSDIYIQGSFAPVWETAKTAPMFYRLGTGTAKDTFSKIFAEAADFRGSDEPFTHFGGEFFVASSEAMRSITEKEEAIFGQMLEREFRVSTGDEFISSLVANTMLTGISLANDYVFRFWTGTYRSISPAYKTTLVCLHVPAEKEAGMLRIFDGYVSAGKVPSREKVWKLLHISRQSPRDAVKAAIKKIIKR